MQRVAVTVGATPAKWRAPPQRPSLHKASGKPDVRAIWNACRNLTVHAILRGSPRPQSFHGMHLGNGELSSQGLAAHPAERPAGIPRRWPFAMSLLDVHNIESVLERQHDQVRRCRISIIDHNHLEAMP
jgi:hypothetical protein